MARKNDRRGGEGKSEQRERETLGMKWVRREQRTESRGKREENKT